MRQLPSRLRRLDDALADLPLEEPMLLCELDGFLTGVLLSPEPVLPAEWLQSVWGSDEGAEPPFDDPADVQWFADAVLARHGEIARDLARGKPQPLFEIDERNGDVLWEMWIDGFAQAMDLRPDAWAAVPVETAGVVARLETLIAVANNESDLDSVQINAMQDRAPAEIAELLVRLHAARFATGALPAVSPTTPRAKVGRNDPCPCGSGRKSKRCCG